MSALSDWLFGPPVKASYTVHSLPPPWPKDDIERLREDVEMLAREIASIERRLEKLELRPLPSRDGWASCYPRLGGDEYE